MQTPTGSPPYAPPASRSSTSASPAYEAAAVRQHLATINGWSNAHVDADLDLTFELWELRSQLPWNLDLTLLADYGIAPPSRQLCLRRSRGRRTLAEPE